MTPQGSSSGKLVPFRNEAAILLALKMALEETETWMELQFADQTGIVPKTLTLFLALVRSVSHGAPTEEIQKNVESLIDFLAELHQVFGSKAFGNPDLDNFKESAKKFQGLIAGLQQQVEELKLTNTAQAQNVVRLEAEAKGSRSTSEEEKAKVAGLVLANNKLLQENGRLRQLNSELNAALRNAQQRLAATRRPDPVELRKLAGQFENSASSSIARMVRVENSLGPLGVTLGELLTHKVALEETLASMRSMLTEAKEISVRLAGDEDQAIKKVVVEQLVVKPPHTGGLDLAYVTREMERYNGYLSDLSQDISARGQEREELEAAVKEASDIIKFGDSDETKPARLELKRAEHDLKSVSVHIDQLLRIEQDVRSKHTLLQRYSQAFVTVNEGLSTEVLGTELPKIPELVYAPYLETTPEPASGAQTTGKKISSLDSFDSNAVNFRINELAKVEGMTNKGILLATLFDLLPPKDGKLRVKGTITVVRAAIEAGIIPALGWGGRVYQLLDGWRPGGDSDPACKYFRFCGRPQNVFDLYQRTTVPLPWNPLELLGEEAVHRFMEEILKKNK